LQLQFSVDTFIVSISDPQWFDKTTQYSPSPTIVVIVSSEKLCHLISS